MENSRWYPKSPSVTSVVARIDRNFDSDRRGKSGVGYIVGTKFGGAQTVQQQLSHKRRFLHTREDLPELTILLDSISFI
eukprot:875275-Prorocentrum_minimum.AAC.1